MKPEHRELLRTHGSVLASNCLVELEAAEAEVDRLRAQVEAQHACVDQAHGARCAALRDLATERAAHEATKEVLGVTRAHFEGLLDTVDECARNLERAQAAEARVAELERDCYSNGHGALVVALEALDQARGLLENAIEYAGGRWCEWGSRAEGVLERLEELQGVLSSSPEPATPAATAKAEIARLRHVENSNQCEIARLREENTRAAQQVADVVSRCGDDLATERAAHEATKAERDEALQYVAELEASHGHAEARIKELEGTVLCNQQAADREYVRREAAEARVAELEAIIGSPLPMSSIQNMQTSLNQVRGLLQEWYVSRYVPGKVGSRADRVRRTREWLRAHPATATPAATCTCGAESSGGPCLCTPATPATTATTAEKARGIKRSRYGT